MVFLPGCGGLGFSAHENTFLKIGFFRKVFFILSNKQVFFCAQKNQNAGGLRTPPGAPADAFGTGDEGAAYAVPYFPALRRRGAFYAS